MKKYVFGPVPSRRLGRSLGIDPVPLKTCNWNCIYCQLGRTSSPTRDRSEYFPTEEIISETKVALSEHGISNVDWLTFAGSGEPTLHSGLGRIIEELKAYAGIPIAVITNGSLLHIPEIRRDLQASDAVLPTLDAGSERLYQRIDRPVRGLTFSTLVDGMCAFREEFTGRFWLEVVLIEGINDSPEALADLATVIERIQPDQVHINLPVRPPAVESVQVPNEESRMRAKRILGQVAEIVDPTAASGEVAAYDSLADAVCEMVCRHPMTDNELAAAFNHAPAEELQQALADLVMLGRVRELQRHRKRFWVSAASQFTGPR